MPAVIGVIAAFPTVLFTVPMGVVVLYWLMVILGALHVNILGAGEGLDGGPPELGAGHSVDGPAPHSLGAPDADLDLPDGDQGGSADAFATLKLRSVPMTVAISLLVTFAWLASIGLEITVARFSPSLVGMASKAVIFAASPLISLALSSLAIRPLAPLFVVHNAAGNSDLIGKVVTIRTGSVDKGFGEATLQEGGGADFVLRVRVDEESALSRGDQALIVAWDEEREAFTVAPMDDLLKARSPEKR